LEILAGLYDTFFREDLNFGLMLGSCVMIYDNCLMRLWSNTNNEIGPSTIFASLSPMQLPAAPKTENHLKNHRILDNVNTSEHAVTILISISDEFQHVLNGGNVLQSVLLYKETGRHVSN
jgi:hypothetical protein